MGVRAVIVVRDETGRERRLWSAWASKNVQTVCLAEFIHTTDLDGIPLNLAGYLAYVQAHPGTLPAHDITDQDAYANPGEVGDLDHRYQLLLCGSQRSFRYLIHNRDRDRPGWRRGEQLGSRAQLYEAAARMCRELAGNTQRYLDHNSALPPGWLSPQGWYEQADRCTGWLTDTDPQLLDRSGPILEAVPQWYAVHAARGLTRRINTTLREAYPQARIRTRVGTDGVVTLTVPTSLTTDVETARIAQTIGRLCDQSFTAEVRPHRPSRYTAHSGDEPSEARVYATLTLRPQNQTAARSEIRQPTGGNHTGQ